MITNQDIALWSIDHPWQNANQVEQDLLLSQAICVIANDPLLGTELVLRGGTAYHRLFLPDFRRFVITGGDYKVIRITEQQTDEMTRGETRYHLY